MENIVMKINSEPADIANEQTTNPLAYVFEENIGKNDFCVSFKLNIPDMDDIEQRHYVTKIIQYMKANADVQMYSHGIHLEGKRNIPHIHIHFIITSSVGWTKVMTNASQHRKRWFVKEGLEYPEGKVLEMKSQPVDPLQPKFHFLAYPMKEGKYFKNGDFFSFLNSPMTTEMRKFLVDYAKNIYDQKVAHDLAADKSEERKEIKYSEILNIARKFTGGSFRDFQVYMEDNYITKLIDAGDSVPDIDNYKKNLKRAAVQLKFFKTYEL